MAEPLDYATPEPPAKPPRARLVFRIAAFVICLFFASGIVVGVSGLVAGNLVWGGIVTGVAGFMTFTFGLAAFHG